MIIIIRETNINTSKRSPAKDSLEVVAFRRKGRTNTQQTWMSEFHFLDACLSKKYLQLTKLTLHYVHKSLFIHMFVLYKLTWEGT